MRRSDGSFRTYDEMVADRIPLRQVGKWTAAIAQACDENGQGRPFDCYMYGVFIARGCCGHEDRQGDL